MLCFSSRTASQFVYFLFKKERDLILKREGKKKKLLVRIQKLEGRKKKHKILNLIVFDFMCI